MLARLLGGSASGCGRENEKVRAVKQTRIICMHLDKHLGKAAPSKKGQKKNCDTVVDGPFSCIWVVAL